MQLGMYLTTLSSPAIKRNVKLKQRTHLCYPSPFVTILPEALAPTAPTSTFPLTMMMITKQMYKEGLLIHAWVFLLQKERPHLAPL